MCFDQRSRRTARRQSQVLYQQMEKASDALDEVFASKAPNDEVLFELAVSKTWLQQWYYPDAYLSQLIPWCGGINARLARCGISEGTVHNIIKRPPGRRRNQPQTGSVGHSRCLHDEIFQGINPARRVDARSTYCYLLAAEEHRDAETWAIHLMYARSWDLIPTTR